MSGLLAKAAAAVVVGVAALAGHAERLSVAAGGDSGIVSMPAYVLRLHEDRSAIRLLWWARSCLKTTAVAREVVTKRLSGEVSRDAIYCTVNESNGEEFLRAVKRDLELAGHVSEVLWGTEVIDGLEVKVAYVEFPQVNGVRPRCKYISSNATGFRGLRGDVIVDELGFVLNLDDIMTAMAGCVSTGGTITMMTSGVTEGSVADVLVEMGRRRLGLDGAGGPRPDDMPVSLHTVTIDQAIAEGVVEYLNHVTGTNFTREGWRAHCRQAYISEERWLQETGCVKKATTESQYFPFSLTRPCCDDGVPMPTMDFDQFMRDIGERVEALRPDAIFAGNDVAKTNDLFVLWVFGRVGSVLHTLGVLYFPTPVLKEMNKEKRTFEMFKQCLRTLMKASFTWLDDRMRPRSVRVNRLCIDRTGLGENISENMEFEFRSRVEGINFNPNTKGEMFPLGRDRLVDRACTLPNDPVVLTDFASVKQVTTAAGHVRFDAVRNAGSHADRACAFVLGVYAAGTKVEHAFMARSAGGDP